MSSSPETADPPPYLLLFPKDTNELDKWVVALIALGGAAMLMGNIVILWNRTYRPIKLKSVPLTLLSSLGGLMWIVAVLVANNHFDRSKQSLLHICVLWTYWLQVCGFSLWLNCLTLRLFALYRIVVCKRGPGTLYGFLVILLLPAIVFCIAASFMGQIHYIGSPPPPPGIANGRRRGNDEGGDCQFYRKNASTAYAVIVLLVSYFLIFLGFAFRLRNAKAQFNEFRLIQRGGILSLFLFLLSLVTIQTRAYYKPVGRCLLSAAVASAIFYYFWARNGIVIYNVLFNKREYGEKFNQDLMWSPSQQERAMFSAAFLEMEGQLRAVRAEVLRDQEKIRQLEDEVRTLEDRAALLQMTSPHASSTNSFRISGRILASPGKESA